MFVYRCNAQTHENTTQMDSEIACLLSSVQHLLFPDES